MKSNRIQNVWREILEKEDVRKKQKRNRYRTAQRNTQS